MSESWFLFAIIFGATLLQSITGFGSALVAMPLLSWLVGVQMATPLMALVKITLEFTVLVHYRASFNLRAVSRLLLSSVAGIPLGIWALRAMPEKTILTILGLLLAGYATYALLAPRLPTLSRQGWAYMFGFVAGCLGGAYNTAGPPVIIYGNLRRWPRDEFKSNLQGFFLLNSVLVTVAHALGGNLTERVLGSYALALPAILLGVILGLSLDRWIRPALFRKIVLVVLLGLGVRLLV